jgi:hypothetical protein
VNIVVSKNKIDYSGSFLKVATLEEACQVRGTIDVLIYNNSNENKNDKIAYLGKLKDMAKKLIYICNDKNTDMAIKMMIIGSDGKYFDDEFFLESSYELDNLINSLDEVTALANLGGVNVLSDFFNRYLKNGSSDFNSNYLMVVKDAVNELMLEYNQKNLEIIQMSETATDIFSNTSALLSNMKKERENMQDIVKKLSENAKESVGVSRRPTGSSVLFYPRINYVKDKNIIRIKEIGDFRYLVSFMLGFRLYLENVKNLRPKLIFVEPVGDLIEERYSDFPWVKTSSVKSSSNYYNDVVFTNCPNKDVLNKLLDDSNYDIFIVVDRTVTDKDHILNSKGSSVKYAVRGISIISKFKLPRKDCICCLSETKGTLLTVPLFPEYPIGTSVRERLYMSELSSAYEKLLLDAKRR